MNKLDPKNPHAVMWSGLSALFVTGLFVLALIWHYWADAVGAGVLAVLGLVMFAVQIQIRRRRG